MQIITVKAIAMKRTFLLAVTTVLIGLWSTMALAVVTPGPSQLMFPRGTRTVRVVQYTFNTVTGGEPVFVSSEGEFIAGNITLGRTTRSVTATLRATPNGPLTGTVAEQLIIPRTVIRRAEELGLNRFQFRRTFVQQTAATPSIEILTLDIAVTTAGGGALQITSMRLYFDNDLGNITIKRNAANLSVRADLQYTGAGLLRAYWLVDGRILSYVNQYLSAGGRLTLNTPEIPGLPTFREGSHTVRLVIQQPDQDIPFPKAIYYVTTDRAPAMIPINLAEPGRTAVMPYTPFRLAWNPAPAATTYLVEFFLKEEDRPVFSAYVAERPDYLLPEPALRHYFVPGKTYDWQVKAFDKGHNLIGESAPREFRLQ